MRARLFAFAFGLLYLVAGSDNTWAQNYPLKSVRVLVGFDAGSAADVLARAVTVQLGTDLGQQFYVENQSGANTTIAIGTLVKADPDGYTLHFNLSSIAQIPHVYKSIRYDIVKDLTPIATIGILDGFLIVVHPEHPAKTIPELIAFARQNHVTYGSPGVGSTPHLAVEMFKMKAGIDMAHVPFRGAEVVSALLSRAVQIAFLVPAGVLDIVKSGQLRALAVSGTQPHPELPNVPLLKNYSPDYPLNRSWGMFFAPAKTPPDIVEKLNAAIRKAVKSASVAKVVQRAGYLPDDLTVTQAAEFLRQEVESAAEFVRAAKLQPN